MGKVFFFIFLLYSINKGKSILSFSISHVCWYGLILKIVNFYVKEKKNDFIAVNIIKCKEILFYVVIAFVSIYIRKSF